jgi:hypothetical protein
LRSMSTPKAFSGEMYSVRTRRSEVGKSAESGNSPNMMRSMATKNAASVLPEPVGAKRSVFWPRAMTGHAFACAAVGVANACRNQPRSVG